jgi:hypothetical protein
MYERMTNTALAGIQPYIQNPPPLSNRCGSSSHFRLRPARLVQHRARIRQMAHQQRPSLPQRLWQIRRTRTTIPPTSTIKQSRYNERGRGDTFPDPCIYIRILWQTQEHRQHLGAGNSL